MICHYCGFRIPPPKLCPACGSLDIGYAGIGTEHIEEEISRYFPDFEISRVDTDNVRQKKDLKEVFEKFRKGHIDILLGTQMVAKGLNFPGVKLVGIINADIGLQLPDFRSLERTFSLIVQVSGRAGRASTDGRVILQTYRPEHDVIRKAVEYRIDDFYREELKMREELRFPPYFRFIRIVFRGRKEGPVESAALQLKQIIEGMDDSGVEILGPVVCPLAVIAGNHRFHLIFRGSPFSRVHKRVSDSLTHFTAPTGVYLEVDLDPLSLL